MWCLLNSRLNTFKMFKDAIDDKNDIYNKSNKISINNVLQVLFILLK